MMYLAELYNSSKYKETNKTISLQKLVEELKQNNIKNQTAEETPEIRFSQNGAVCVSKWNIKKITEK